MSLLNKTPHFSALLGFPQYIAHDLVQRTPGREISYPKRNNDQSKDINVKEGKMEHYQQEDS